MYSDQWLGLPSALDIQPSREEKIAQQHLDSLVAAGLLSPASAREGSRRQKAAIPPQRGGEHTI